MNVPEARMKHTVRVCTRTVNGQSVNGPPLMFIGTGVSTLERNARAAYDVRRVHGGTEGSFLWRLT